MKARIKSVEDMETFGSSFVENISMEKSNSTALIVGLKGDLGAGKTVFAKSVAKALGVNETVTSPTFVIEKVYKLPHGRKFSRLIHIDAYRLENSSELLHVGWDDIVSDSSNLILVEWPERVLDILPKDVKMIEFKFVDENTREVEY